MFGQIKMEVPWYINRHTLISRKRDGKPRMIGGQFVVVRVGVHQLSVSPNTSRSSYASNLFFSLGGVTATAPSMDLTDNKKKRREGSSRGESKRKLLKET